MSSLLQVDLAVGFRCGKECQVVPLNFAPAMTSYASQIMVRSAIAVAYIFAQPQVSGMQQAASALHAKAWGKPWPQSKGIISKTEISGHESGSVDDDDDVDDGLADKLKVPPEFHYRYFKEIRGLKRALSAYTGQDIEDFLVVRDEYDTLRRVLEDDLKYKRSIVVTGHSGIGSYESWFSSLESNADFSLRQDLLSLLPSFISS
jgi:hypothetical protein